MKRIAILGANSYIARNVIYYLEHFYPEIELLLYDIAQEQSDGKRNYQQINMTDRESIAGIDLDCDAIFMFVGKTGTEAGFTDYKTFLDVNELALLNLLSEYSSRGFHGKIIFPSTRLVYKGEERALCEDAPKEFNTVYAINKFACEQYLRQFERAFGVRYCIFRICVPYGTLIPGAQSYGTIGYMLNKARRGENISLYGDGSVRRTFTHIFDLCENLVSGALSDDCTNDVFNIGGEALSLKETAELIAGKYGVRIEYTPYPALAGVIESGDTVFDAAKLASLGITANRSFLSWLKEEL